MAVQRNSLIIPASLVVNQPTFAANNERDLKARYPNMSGFKVVSQADHRADEHSPAAHRYIIWEFEDGVT